MTCLTENERFGHVINPIFGHVVQVKVSAKERWTMVGMVGRNQILMELFYLIDSLKVSSGMHLHDYCVISSATFCTFRKTLVTFKFQV